jgi:hypothetical protein
MVSEVQRLKDGVRHLRSPTGHPTGRRETGMANSYSPASPTAQFPTLRDPHPATIQRKRRKRKRRDQADSAANNRRDAIRSLASEVAVVARARFPHAMLLQFHLTTRVPGSHSKHSP